MERRDDGMIVCQICHEVLGYPPGYYEDDEEPEPEPEEGILDSDFPPFLPENGDDE
jgi:hypothetical protein